MQLAPPPARTLSLSSARLVRLCAERSCSWLEDTTSPEQIGIIRTLARCKAHWAKHYLSGTFWNLWKLVALFVGAFSEPIQFRLHLVPGIPEISRHLKFRTLGNPSVFVTSRYSDKLDFRNSEQAAARLCNFSPLEIHSRIFNWPASNLSSVFVTSRCSVHSCTTSLTPELARDAVEEFYWPAHMSIVPPSVRPLIMPVS